MKKYLEGKSEQKKMYFKEVIKLFESLVIVL